MCGDNEMITLDQAMPGTLVTINDDTTHIDISPYMSLNEEKVFSVVKVKRNGLIEVEGSKSERVAICPYNIELFNSTKV